MSGFEVAGLVLGVVPLLISALEGYQKVKTTYRLFKNRSIHIGKMIHSLRAQHSLIQGDVEIVLRNAEVDAEHLEDLAHTVLTSILSREEVKDEVKAFLGSNYQSYEQVLEDCQRVLHEVACCISTYKEGSWIAHGSLTALLDGNSHSTSTSKEVWKRVRFSMKKDEIDRAIEELDQATRRLERLSQQRSQLKQISNTSASSKTKAAASLLRKVQHKAAMLHQALSSHWSAQCQHPRQARLYLEMRPDESRDGQTRAAPFPSKSKKLTFRVTLESEGHYTHSFMYTCDVHMDENESIATSGRVTFGALPSSTVATPKTTVSDICQLIHSFSAGPDILRLFLDDDANLRYCIDVAAQHGIFEALQPQYPSMISLQGVLRTKSVNFSRKLRVKMAALVASSILQLHATPWAVALRDHTIFFIQDAAGSVEFRHPFITCRFDNCTSQICDRATQGEADLLELGIIIMELWAGESLDEYAWRRQLTVDNTYDTRQFVARRWLDELRDDFITTFYEAALRCVNCRFDATTIDLSDPKLNRDVFELVVKPLWDSCGH